MREAPHFPGGPVQLRASRWGVGPAVPSVGWPEKAAAGGWLTVRPGRPAFDRLVPGVAIEPRRFLKPEKTIGLPRPPPSDPYWLIEALANPLRLSANPCYWDARTSGLVHLTLKD